MLLVTTWFGSFLCENGTVASQRLFPMDAREIASRMGILDSGEILNEELALLKSTDFSADVYDSRLARHGRVSDERIDIRPADFSFPMQLLHDALILLGSDKSRERPHEDFHIIQALRTVDSLTECINLLSERVRDWYAVHFPELERLVPSEKYLSLVADAASRADIASKIRFTGESIGSPLGGDDEETLREVARGAVALLGQRSKLEGYIGQKMKKSAPNLTFIAGPVLGARLISIAGGLGKLSGKPSSTIQLLGAENALFRHLRSGAKPPKYGIIFQHPYVHGAERKLRGRAARSLAGAISIAAKVDYNNGKFVAESLKQRLDARIKSMRVSGKGGRDMRAKPAGEGSGKPPGR